jgi:hypothetical protein
VVLFTSRSAAATGLPATTINCAVPALQDDVAEQLLTATGMQLSNEQSKVVLRYCAGLPLALLILRGTLERADPARIADVCARLRVREPITYDNRDQLLDDVGYSVRQLNRNLQQAWYDIAMLLRDNTRWSELEHLYGASTMRELQLRSLVSPADAMHDYIDITGEVAWVHDVLVTYAYQQCGPGSSQFRIRGLDASAVHEQLEISASDKVSVSADAAAFLLLLFSHT